MTAIRVRSPSPCGAEKSSASAALTGVGTFVASFGIRFIHLARCALRTITRRVRVA